ncbi:M24 family metallopeptidase [Rossellomorea sp. YZS02]|uniref:M24 family metallopeptidase n=1 Tax=Rossellomorea sp. YZS02 TaxID=3097358 RepID=UPI002A18489B|nr:M24 family metallopeptidase [Rossellomorea sp. YZS02]MDX8344446.1 M24 family metallopeptidase [Rossellomorea sp. YZS02]
MKSEKNIIPAVLPLKKREETQNRWLFHRLNTLLPTLMEKHDVNMWIVVGREYNEDPVLKSLYPASIDSSRRLTILVFYLDSGKHLRRWVLHPNPNFEPFYERVWNPEECDQWECLRRLVDEHNPDNIALNYSSTFAVADGLSHSHFQHLSMLLDDHSHKFTSAQHVIVDWLSIRTSKELVAYPSIAELGRTIAEEALSRAVIHPGITTTEDVVDWIRQRVLDEGMETSFYPTVDLQRKGSDMDRLEGEIIRFGDIVHLDFGIRYLGLTTDTQQLAYVLYPGEVEAPEGLQSAFETALRFEDIITEEMKIGRTGNEVFYRAMKKAREEEIEAMLYSHPIGNHCHEAGALIGLYDVQGDIPIRGDLPLTANSCYAMEFNIKQYIPEWNQIIPIYLEEPVAFMQNRLEYMSKRQTSFYLI